MRRIQGRSKLDLWTCCASHKHSDLIFLDVDLRFCGTSSTHLAHERIGIATAQSCSDLSLFDFAGGDDFASFSQFKARPRSKQLIGRILCDE